jgi:uncharacterized protein YfdQ (DUF2303 family)
MKLQQILSCNTLLENEADTSSDASLQSIWEQNSDSISSFRPNVEYSVKKVGDQFEVNKVVQDRRKLKKISEDELNKSFVKASETSTDAEGFDTYISNQQVEAFQYQGDSIVIKSDGNEATLEKSDYIVKKPVGTDFEFMVVHQSEFESKFTEVV